MKSARVSGIMAQRLHTSEIVAKTLEKDMGDINRRYDALCQRRDTLIEELRGAKLTDDAIQDVIQFAEDIRIGIENADYVTKRRNLELLRIKVIVEAGRFTVSSLLGGWTGDIPAWSNGAVKADLYLQSRVGSEC